mgnify:FL=1
MRNLTEVREYKQNWPMPKNPIPIVIFGAGSIVSDAHLPAYKLSKLPVKGIYDPDYEKAKKLGQIYGIEVFKEASAAAAEKNVVFDLATPPSVHFEVIDMLPKNSTVILQKPMGGDLKEASNILSLCHQKSLTACVNFQLRFAPMMIALKDIIDQGLIGQVVDVDMWAALDTPWDLWKFLEALPRVEILLHSIHYLDAIRFLIGNPIGIHAKTMGHPASKISNTRTSAILDYGNELRCAISINHNHSYGRKYQACELRICGTKGAAYLHLGVNLNYPKGEPDRLEVNLGNGWKEIKLEGSWFIESFAYRMRQLQRAVAGEDDILISKVDDAWNTMALVESAYKSSSKPATKIPKYSNSNKV